MNDVRLAAVIRAVEAKYRGTRCIVEPWTDPDGDPDIRCQVHVLNVRPAEAGPLRLFATRLALDLFAPGPKPFFLSILDRKTSASFLARRANEARRDRARSQRMRRPAEGARNRRGSRPARTRPA
ncbi:MAG TPA: hypothetical protein VFV36_01260 [Candidatus Methylomirabilis sp.]|nr:hypothetical protein [Candidatus Methylomirabilis sp.]